MPTARDPGVAARRPRAAPGRGRGAVAPRRVVRRHRRHPPRHDADLDGHRIEAGEKVFISWVSANRDEAVFDDPHRFRLDRPHNRHLSFGAGPHRCAGSHLARLNLRIALGELVHRLRDVELDLPVEDIEFHSAFNRVPLRVPIRFTPGTRVGA
ncbi:MAG: cytochrome P450 [Acidimicrobiales bacterium]|nr:cytochrome P450 [Acidimicrobiales bacterium]